jgi:hypothetical protein
MCSARKEVTMTSDDIKNILESVATVMEAIAAKYPIDLMQKIEAYLSSMSDANVEFLGTLLGIDLTSLKIDIDKGLAVMQTLDKLFGTDQAQQSADFARKLENRPLVLKFLAWKMG